MELKFNFKEDLNLKAAGEENDCKGLFWRANVSSFLSDKTIQERVQLRFLKRKSCKGCSYCDWLWESLGETIEEGIVSKKEIEHGKIYTYNVVTSKGYYDLYADIDYIEFVEVKDKENVR